ncbi:elongation factor P [Methylocella sp.]|uniref:elongation factor P n=1 Tax=Methylocella sp. TaxID=1978226 RepID=UPI0037834508
MPKLNGNQIAPGAVISHDGGLWVAVKTNSVKPGKGGAFNQVELKNLVDGRELEFKDFSFLYAEGGNLVFMDLDTYDQIELPRDFVGERAAFLQDGMKVTLQMHEARPISIRLPQQVTLEIVEADPVVKGQTAASSYKPAVLENGLRVLVPPFIGAGEKIVVDTNEVSYLRRAEA